MSALVCSRIVDQVAGRVAEDVRRIGTERHTRSIVYEPHGVWGWWQMVWCVGVYDAAYGVNGFVAVQDAAAS